MSGQVMAVAIFCLATGAALGCLFLLFRGISLLLGLGRLAAGLFDAVFAACVGALCFSALWQWTMAICGCIRLYCRDWGPGALWFPWVLGRARGSGP